jgi:hypothetical protein
MVSNRRPFSFNFVFGNSKKSQGAKSGKYGGWGWQTFCFSPETAGWGQKCETGRCHGEADRSVLAKVRGEVFARFHAVAVEPVIHSLACCDRCFALPQLLWHLRRHQSGIFWIPPRIWNLRGQCDTGRSGMMEQLSGLQNRLPVFSLFALFSIAITLWTSRVVVTTRCVGREEFCT